MNIGSKLHSYLENPYTNLDVSNEDIDIAEPPTDDSHTTRMELEKLEQLIQEAKLPREIMRVADRDPLRLFYSVAKKKGLDPLEEEAKEWADDWTKLSFDFKLKFKRRRPWEVKKEHDIDFVVNKSDTTESPSYPSGHAMMGYGVAEFYKDKYPLMADEWDNVAEIIAHSRLQMGVHYPSDVEASKKIVEQLVEQGIKLAEWEKEAGRSAAYRRLSTIARQQYRRWVKSNPGRTVEQWQSHTAKAPGSVPSRVSAPTATYRGGTQSTRAPVSTPAPTNTAPKSPVTVSSSKKAPGQGVSNVSQPMQKASPTAPATQAPATTAPATTAPAAPQTWGQRFTGVGNWASKNPMQATAAGGATAFGGYKGFEHFTQPKQPNLSNQMPKFGSLGHLEQRRSERAKFMSKEDLASLEKKVRRSKDLPEGAHYITLPHGRKGVVRTEEGKSHLATILDARMRPPGRDLTKLINSTSGHSKEARALVKSLANMARFSPTGTALEIYGTRAGKRLYQSAQVGQRAVGKANAKLRQAYYSPEFLNANLAIQRNVNPATVADDVGNVINFFKGSSQKTAAEKLRLYHGSPHDLETLEPRQPNKGTWGEHGLYGTPNQLVAALYAIARNDSKGSWGVLPEGRLIAKSKKQLNPEGYVYEYDSDDYIPPPEDDPGIGYASQSIPKILSKEKVYLDNLRDSITRVDDRDKFLEYFKKTSSEQPLLRHRATLLIRDPETGKILAANKSDDPRFEGISPYHFPGGGLYSDEYSTPRTPTEEEIIAGARREALEELGIALNNAKVVGSTDLLLPEYKEKALSVRGAPYIGKHEHYVLADKGKADSSLYNVEGDAFTKGDYYDPQTLYESLVRYGRGDNSHAPLNAGQARAIKEHLLSKTSSAKEQLKHILVIKAALEDEFQPDLTPDALKALGVYDQVYGDAPSEASMKEWPEHWINKQDPLGWLQWYDRYSEGRRTDDDERQMKRWKSFKARHLAQYLKKPTPRRAAALRNWGIDVEKY